MPWMHTEEWRYSSLTLDGGEWSGSWPTCFKSAETAPSAYWTVGWITPMEPLEKGETSCPCWEFKNFLVIQPTPWSLSDNGIPTQTQSTSNRCGRVAHMQELWEKLIKWIIQLLDSAYILQYTINWYFIQEESSSTTMTIVIQWELLSHTELQGLKYL
jgi:hypothetical protein